MLLHLREINAPDNYVNREWNWAVRQAYLKQDDGLILAAAKRATDMGWYDRANLCSRSYRQASTTIVIVMPCRIKAMW